MGSAVPAEGSNSNQGDDLFTAQCAQFWQVGKQRNRYLFAYSGNAAQQLVSLPPYRTGFNGSSQVAVQLVFSVNYFCRLRRLFLPVHLLFLTPFLSHSGSIARDVAFQDDRVVDHPVDGRRGCHWVGEDMLPLGEDQIGHDTQGS